jgi:predicted acetyltransferase
VLAGHLVENVRVELALPEESAVLTRMMQLYIHDFSEFWAGTPRGELKDDGTFVGYPLDDYWKEPARVPLLIRQEGHIVGFALLNSVTHSGRPADRNMAEFFIVRKHRRSGVGLAVAREIFSRYPGLWEVAVARRNIQAQAFWRRVIGGHAAARDVEELDMTSAAWNGPIIRFRIAG